MAVVMFALSTAEVLVLLVQGAAYYGPLSLPVDSLDIAITVIYVTNKCVNDESVRVSDELMPKTVSWQMGSL